MAINDCAEPNTESFLEQILRSLETCDYTTLYQVLNFANSEQLVSLIAKPSLTHRFQDSPVVSMEAMPLITY